MESAQEAGRPKVFGMLWKGFNPCCNGKCSGRRLTMTSLNLRRSFNPCCNGKCSGSDPADIAVAAVMKVSILVVMESAQEGGGDG